MIGHNQLVTGRFHGSFTLDAEHPNRHQGRYSLDTHIHNAETANRDGDSADIQCLIH